jgi:hypothetical protein
MKIQLAVIALVVAASGHELQAQQVPTPSRAAPAPRETSAQQAGYTLGGFFSQCGEAYDVVVEPAPGREGGYVIALYDENERRVEVRVNPRDGSLALVSEGTTDVYTRSPTDEATNRPRHRRRKTNRQMDKECGNQPGGR